MLGIRGDKPKYFITYMVLAVDTALFSINDSCRQLVVLDDKYNIFYIMCILRFYSATALIPYVTRNDLHKINFIRTLVCT